MIDAVRHLGWSHYGDVIMASQTTCLMIVCATFYPDSDQRKHQGSASLAFVRGIHRWLVNSPHKGPVTRKMFPFDDVIRKWVRCRHWHDDITPMALLRLSYNWNYHTVRRLTGEVKDDNWGNANGPFYWHGLTLNIAWISNHMTSKVWDEINYPFSNFGHGYVISSHTL